MDYIVSSTPVPDLPDRESALLFQAIAEAAEHADLGVLITRSDPEATKLELVYFNATLERMTGRTRGEILEVGGLLPFVPLDQRTLLTDLNAARIRGERLPARFSSAFTHKNGHVVPVEATLVPIMIGGQALNVSFLVDVTQRRDAEAALRRSQELFQQVVASAPDGIYIMRWPNIVFANPAGARILDFDSPDEVVGLNVLERLSPEATSLIEQRTRRSQGVRPPEPHRYRGRNPSGREFAVEVSSLQTYFNSEPAVLAFARDVTERDAMLSLLLEVHKQSAVSALAAGVAHEINNPLAYVLLNLEFLARELRELGGDPLRIKAMQQRLEDTRQGAERVKTIVRDLQALTRKDEDIRGRVDLDQVLEHALHMAKRELRQRGRVETRYHPVPCVLGNPTRLEQLFFNLIVNAAHALSETDTHDRVIRVSLRQGSDGRVIAEISDNGCGMRDEVLARAFEPFYTTKPLGVGAGLGLPICKRIVDDLGGTITIQSKPGEGTTVTVYFNPAIGHTTSAPPPPAAMPNGRRSRILVVDDERAVAESLCAGLRDVHDVDTATSVAEARALLVANGEYDVVLCDVAMPMESGAVLHAYARQHHPALAQRFIFMTGGAYTDDMLNFISSTQCPHVEKPFGFDEIRSLVDATIAQRSAAVTPTPS
ncbi:MAG TPA: ATP-binding protein [Polyangiales bacterium]|nr:ATP-binding protein [Polyangiales bacterium]